MKRATITLVLYCMTASAFCQDDKFNQAIDGLFEIGYFNNTKPQESTTGYHVTTDTSKFWINVRIKYCKQHSSPNSNLSLIDLIELRSIKYVTVRSITEIRENIHATADLIELEFNSERSAAKNSGKIDQLTPSERECIDKAPWIQWRIANRIYFILTKATLFGSEIPKIKAKLDEKLNEK